MTKSSAEAMTRPARPRYQGSSVRLRGRSPEVAVMESIHARE